MPEDWKHQVALGMRCKISKKGKHGATTALRMGESLPNHHEDLMKTILQEKEKIHYSTTLWFTDLFLCSKPSVKAAVDKEWET